MRLRRARVLLAMVAGSLLLTGCDFDVYKLPLPGGTDVGDDPIRVTVQFADVLDLVPRSSVKVNDVSVGQVTGVVLDGNTAEVSLALRNDTELPDNTIAEIRQTSLLGEKFVSLRAPDTGATGRLETGDTIELANTGRNPEVEEVLGALSLVLNGGGVAQLKTIASELNLALEGREDSARSVLTQIRSFMATLDDNKAEIVDAIESLDRLARSARQQQTTIDAALDELPSAIASIDQQREDLVRMLQALNRLGDVGVRVIEATKADTIATVRNLQPVLTQLANSGDHFVNAFQVFLTYPFVDEVVGRDPQVARDLRMGDFTNLSVRLDLDLTQPPAASTACVPLSLVPDDVPLADLPANLCPAATARIERCLADLRDGRMDTRACADVIQRLPQEVIGSVCTAVGTMPGLGGLGVPTCPSGGSGGSGGGTGGTGAPVDLGQTVDDLLGALPRPAPGWSGDPNSSSGGVTLAQLSEVYDPALVELLVPALADAAETNSGTTGDRKGGGAR